VSRTSIPGLFATLAERYADKAAQISHAAGSWSRIDYSTLLERARRVSGALKTAGLEPGDAVVLPSRRTPNLCAHLLGILWAGGHYVFVDPTYPPEHQTFLATDCGARLGLADGDDAPLEVPVQWLQVDWPTQSPDPGEPVANADLPAYIVFTSGSTGTPKGVVVPHRAVVRLVRDTDYIDFSPDQVFLQLSALSFDASTLELWGPLLNGGTCVLHPEEWGTNAAAIRDSIELHGVTTLWITSSLFNALISEHPETVRSVRQLLTGGEALSVAHIRRGLELLPDTQLFNGYGPTENTTFTTVYRIPRILPADTKRIPIGLPINGTQCEIFNDKLEPETDPRKTGELIAFGEGVALGYLNRPELTAERFIDVRCADGVVRRGYRTGDLVFRNEDGSYEFVARNDKQLKIDGHRIEPGEIELYLNQLPGIVEARVVVRVGPSGQKRLAAYVVGKDSLDRSGLRRQLGRHFPAYMVPHFLVPMQALPKNQNGKLDEARLPDPFAEPGRNPDDLAGVARAWREILGRAVETDVNFLDAGGTSLEAVQLAEALAARFSVALPATFVFEYPTIASQERYFRQPTRDGSGVQAVPQARTEIAVVGMAARLPGASDVREYWRNLLDGRESITFFNPDELDTAVDADERARPNYVAAKGVVEDSDKFDAAFFGVSPIEADLMDPQHRLLLELAWHALEDAGIVPGDDQLRTGVFVGANWARYYQQNVLPNIAVTKRVGGFTAALANETDFLCTRLSYKLNLKGPSVNVYTACSTGLVAIAQACAAVEQGECEQAIAGGVSIITPIKSGYLYQEGGMLSNDGHCRPFDVNARGTTFNDGAAVVVLKRRDLAERDGDRIYAVVRGYAVNNDGAERASFTAPSVAGQVAVYRQALRKAGIPAKTIGLVETHGTATPLGDPIEVESLRQAFDVQGSPEKRCALGSVKSNIGHVIHAAGAAGFIKAVLAVNHAQIPATLFYTAPNPKLGLDRTPFFVNATAISWPIPGPRRAAVNSLGVGGTNAQVIIEAYPERPDRASDKPARAYPLVLSAKTADALDRQVHAYQEFLAQPTPAELVDLAFTAATARKAFPFRASVSGATLGEWRDRLAKRTPGSSTRMRPIAQPKTGFLFSGQGSQRLGMGRGLYESEPLYRRTFDDGADHLQRSFGFDLRKLLFASPSDDAATAVQQTAVAQPALFLMEYGIAQLLAERGLRPDFVIGHSIGEFAAACLAGVLDFEEALTLVARRGARMQAMAPGIMMVVKATIETVESYIHEPVSLAAVNAPKLLVLSGPSGEIQALRARLESERIRTSILNTSHAFHSSMMQEAADGFFQDVAASHPKPARLPILSTKTGQLTTETELCKPEYWASQLRQPVLFSAALMAAAEAYGADSLALVEVGPGNALSTLASSHSALDGSVKLASQPSSGATEGASSELVDCIGTLWTSGFLSDLSPVFLGTEARKTSLPGYAFARERHWLDVRTNDAPAQPHSDLVAPIVVNTIQEIPMSNSEHVAAIQTALKSLLEEVTGYDLAEMDTSAQFSEVGLDSLLLTQAATAIDRKYNIGLTFRHLVEDYTSMDDLAAFVASKVPVATKTVSVPQVAPPPSPMAVPAAPAAVSPTATPAIPALALPATLSPVTLATGGSIHDLINTQLQVLLQLATVSSANLLAATLNGTGAIVSQPAPLPAAASAPSVTTPAATAAPSPVTTAPGVAAPSVPATAVRDETEAPTKPRHTPGTRITREVSGHKLTSAQKEWVDDFLGRYQKRFAQSKAMTQRYRKHLADPRTVSGFNPEWKEIVFPIVVKGSKGSKLWDIDGNELIDTSNGFGPIFFGHSPDFVVEAVKEQLGIGIETGPQSPMAGEVAELFCELTGHERCAFASTGSETVTGALRLARTVTGRPKVVMFEGDYHGIFDEVVVRPGRNNQALPAAPGINRETTANMLILPWGEPSSIDAIRKLGTDLAAVLCEPVQSRKPEFHSREYIQQLRAVTEEIGAALILDEVVTGFRVHPGGIRRRFDVDADLCCYGKVVGGGYPIGIIGGKAKFMDALDGGYWQYGDASIPQVGVTFFAGTFVRHPVALAAARAVLRRIKEGGTALYEDLERRTTALAAEAKQFIASMKADVHFEEFASLFYVATPAAAHWGHLLFLMMAYEGIHIQQYRPNFLTTEHSSADVEKILGAFKSSLAQLVLLGLIEGDAAAAKKFLSGNGSIPPGARLGKNAQGVPAYFIEDPNNAGKYIEVGRP
jgi:amino acid adenylation domain-containing protein